LIFCLYQIITYNRRIIAGSPTPQNGFDCAPDFSVFYRWLYIGLATSWSIFLLRNFNQYIGSQWLAIFGLFLVGILRGLFLISFRRKTDYFGHYATVCVIVSFLFNCFGFNAMTALLVPLLGIHIWTKRLRLI
jgi:hypothetical protein